MTTCHGCPGLAVRCAMGIVVSAVATGLVHSIAGAECRQLPCGDTLGQKVRVYLICHKVVTFSGFLEPWLL